METSPCSTGVDAAAPREFAASSPDAALRAEIAQRLSVVCSHLPKDDFDVLVRDIAEFRRRWSIPQPDSGDRESGRDD